MHQCRQCEHRRRKRPERRDPAGQSCNHGRSDGHHKRGKCDVLLPCEVAGYGVPRRRRERVLGNAREPRPARAPGARARTAAAARAPGRTGLASCPHDPLDRRGERRPVSAALHQRATPRPCHRVHTPATAAHGPPSTRQMPCTLQPVQSRIDRPLREIERARAARPQILDDPVPVCRLRRDRREQQ